MQTTHAPLEVFERRYLHDKRQEHGQLYSALGNLIVQRDGGDHTIDFNPDELVAARGGLLSHNHPKGRPPSKEDLMVAADSGLTVRAFGVDPLGQPHTYIVEFDQPSPSLAQRIGQSFDELMQQAETTEPADSAAYELWLQRTRHQIVTLLSKHYGFPYLRLNHGNLSEASGHEKRRLDVLGKLETDLRSEVFSPLHASIARSLTRRAGSKGIVPMSALAEVQSDIARAVQMTILGSLMQDESYAPFVTRAGQIQPRSPYAKVMIGSMIAAAHNATQRHADIMRKYLPIDMVRALQYATVSPFAQVTEMGDEPDPLHEWLGEDDRTLLGRIWNVAGDLRNKIDRFVTGLVAQGKTTSQMSAELQQYLDGVGGYEARRLARNETANAGNRADWLAAKLNPFVEMYQPFTSPTHKEVDRCDDMVAGGPYPKDDIEHLPTYHPECLCGIYWTLVENPEAVVNVLRSKIAKALSDAKTAFTDIVGPLSQRFVPWLFGDRK